MRKNILIMLIAATLIVMASPLYADTNVSLLYGYNGSSWRAYITSADGTLQLNPNITSSLSISPKTNNTFSIGSAALQWSEIYASNIRSAGPLSLYAGGTEKVTILAGGNTGFGNTNPQQALVVSGQANLSGTAVLNGTMNVRGALYNFPSGDGSTGQLLTTNGTGGLTWTTPVGASPNISARNVTAGTFGADVGDGFYSFPNNISVSQNISASGRITDKTGFVMPVGSIMPYTDPIVPAGWLMANGTEVSRTTYADLFNITGTRYGNTSETTFTLPNLKQRFALGVADSGTGSTLGGTGGTIDHVHTGPSHTHGYSTVISHTHSADPPSTGSDSQGSHSHSASTGSEAAHTHAADPPSTASDSQGSHTHTVSIEARAESGGDTPYNNPFAGAGTGTTSSDGAHTHSTDIASFTSGAGSSHSHSISSDGGHTHSTDIASFTSGSTGSASGTSDAAGTGNTGTGNPPFIALYYIIKY